MKTAERMKMWIDKIRKKLILKLGGYVQQPEQRVRIEQVQLPIRTVRAEATYASGCPHSQLKKMVARELADRICDAGFVEYEYSDHPAYHTYDMGLVRATIRVVERREGCS